MHVFDVRLVLLLVLMVAPAVLCYTAAALQVRTASDIAALQVRTASDIEDKANSCV